MVEYCNFIWYNLRMTPAGRQLGSLFPAEKTASEREMSQEAKVSVRFTWPSWPPLALGDDAADSLTGVGSSGSFVSSEDGSTVPPTLPWGPSGLSVWHALG